MFASKKKNQGNAPEELRELLAKVQNPATHQDIVSGGHLEAIDELDDGKFQITLKLPNDRRLQLAIEAQVRTTLSDSPIAPDSVKIKFVEGEVPAAAANPPQPAQPAQQQAPGAGVPKPRRIDGVKNLILVGSGKGGVGKSTVSANLAFSLAALDKNNRVGLMDADIYGPSLGKMVGKNGRIPMQVENDRLIPLDLDGLKMMSFSFLVEEKQAIVWRGPMLGKAVEQFLFDVEWGELDYLVVDLPPGTGDVQLSLAQLIEVDGAVIVTTPQNIALQDATRAVSMFEQVNIPVLGVIENMSEFICPHCGKGSHIFSSGGGDELATHTESSLLGQIPLTVALMESGEKGAPVCSPTYPDAKTVEQERGAFSQVAKNLAGVIAKL